MIRRHVLQDLAAYAEDQLDRGSTARVEAHLSSCAECREALARVREGIGWANQLEAEQMPGDVAARIRERLAEERATESMGPSIARRAFQWWQAAATLVLVLLGVAVYWQVNRPWVRLHAASNLPTPFEAEGRMLHDQLKSGDVEVSFKSQDESELWRWLTSQSAPVTTAVVSRSSDDRARVLPVGAAVHTLADVRTSVLTYRIDGHPVTLALAHAHDVHDAPAAGWWSKRVTHRRDASGVNTLTWTVGGGTYVMVSELEGAGQRACVICHTTPRFTQRLRRLTD
jgi:anti-sigma factor RsiW